MKEVFLKITKLPRPNESDYWDPFQMEVVVMDGKKLVKRQTFQKPDHKSVILAKAQNLLDPESDWSELEIKEIIEELPEKKNEKASISA